MNIVLIGKNGQLGRELQQALQPLGHVTALGRSEIDLAEPQHIPALLAPLHPQLIVNAAAYTEVDQAETQRDLAMRINAASPGALAEAARKAGAVFVHYSTDYVFDGTATRPYVETDATHPLNVYGASKLAGEQNVQQAGDAYLILRTSWVYSLQGNSFVNKVLGWARKNTTLKIVSDQTGSPTWARMLAEYTVRALMPHQSVFLDALRERRGLYHLSGAGAASRYEWAQRILALDSKPTEQLVQAIEPVSSFEFPTPATRPMYSVLDCSKFCQTFGLSLPSWEESLQQAMKAALN